MTLPATQPDAPARITLAVGSGGGLYRLPAAFAIAIAITLAAVNAWVRLVEVLR